MTGAINSARRRSHNWNTSLDYAWNKFRGGTLEVYGRLIYYTRYDHLLVPGAPSIDELTHPEGAANNLLRYSANFGAGWSGKSWGFGLDGHYFHSRVLPRSQWQEQGRDRIRPYWQCDAFVQGSLSGLVHWLPDRLNVQVRVTNVLGADFPTFVHDSSGAGVQTYGDWRRRTYSLSLTTRRLESDRIRRGEYYDASAIAGFPAALVMLGNPPPAVTTAATPTPQDDPALRETLKRCSPATYYAACKFRQTANPDDLRILVTGVIERFVERSNRAAIASGSDTLRLRENLGLDSLTMIEIVILAEEVLPLTVANEELAQLHTLGDVQTFIARKVAAARSAPRPAPAPASSDWDVTIVQEHIQHIRHIRQPEADAARAQSPHLRLVQAERALPNDRCPNAHFLKTMIAVPIRPRSQRARMAAGEYSPLSAAARAF